MASLDPEERIFKKEIFWPEPDFEVRDEDEEELPLRARRIRVSILEMIAEAGSGHPGGSLSCVEILVTLFFRVMRYDPENPRWEKRDRFILSEGHVAPALYAALAEAGCLPKEELKTLRELDSRLQGHPSAIHLPWVEFSSGILGQGLSFANGRAMALRLKDIDARCYVLLSDAEMQSPQVWAAAQTASHWQLPIIAIVNYNQWQLDGRIEEIKRIEPLREKWEAFGWTVVETDGHSFPDLICAFQRVEFFPPGVIIARTIKGKGVSFMEDNNDFHGRALKPQELEKAFKELGGER